MTTPVPTRDSVVRLADLVIRPEGDDFVVGDPRAGEFVILPAVGARAVEHLRAGLTVGEAAAALEREFGEDPELDDFVEQLIELGFVTHVDQVPIGGTGDQVAPNLPWLRAGHVGWLFSLPAKICYVLLIAAASTVLAGRPELRPSYQKLIFTENTTFVLCGSTAMFLLIVAMHEFAHLAAARSFGVPSRISLGTRLYSLVAQTDISGMWALPKRQRMRGYVAGVVNDLVLASVLVLVAAGGVLPDGVVAVSSAAVVLILVGIAAQCQFFMRTDFYFVIADLLDARNLYQDAMVQLLWTAGRLTGRGGRPDPLAHLPARERRIVRWFAWFVLVGTVVAVTVFAVLLLPALVALFVEAARNLAEGLSAGRWAPVLDGGLTLLIEGGFQVLFLVILVRSRRAWVGRLRDRLDGSVS